MRIVASTVSTSVDLAPQSSAEEALLKRATTFHIDDTHGDTALTTCERIVKGRKDQLDACTEELKTLMAEAVELRRKIGKTENDEYLVQFIATLNGAGWGDAEADEIARNCWEEASGQSLPVTAASTDKSKAVAAGKKGGKAAKKTENKSEKQADLEWALREKTHHMRRGIKEATGRVRSHRYFAAVREVQAKGSSFQLVCPECSKTVGLKDVSLLSGCGHMGCSECVRNLADKEECVFAASGKCRDAARVANIVPAHTLGTDDGVHDGKHFGRKIEEIVDYIKYAGVPFGMQTGC